ncbi:hypothetical protein [Winogradskyella bathintestinalis]|uniref:Uncharacterized protein n=1 Tax=Winogradskyella bathintestinalis TaxID=3035208 RepID=A0ABT7ZRW9_9FLAO|nr:hypothetical protein [Winogradskyella bathintestinalis]MDN3491714.1 hypothetical protein [Winogradskyella bathintestinalis]
MQTTLNEALNELKLSYMNVRPNLDDVLAELKVEEANYYRRRVMHI